MTLCFFHSDVEIELSNNEISVYESEGYAEVCVVIVSGIRAIISNFYYRHLQLQQLVLMKSTEVQTLGAKCVPVCIKSACATNICM